MQLSAFNEINKSYSEQPELKEGLEFINAADFPSIFVNIRPGMIEIIKSNLSKNELKYLNYYVNQPEVKKHFSLATQHKSYEKAA